MTKMKGVALFARKEVFSSNSNVGTEIKIDGVLDATETHSINEITNRFQFYAEQMH